MEIIHESFKNVPLQLIVYTSSAVRHRGVEGGRHFSLTHIFKVLVFSYSSAKLNEKLLTSPIWYPIALKELKFYLSSFFKEKLVKYRGGKIPITSPAIKRFLIVKKHVK